MMTGENDGKQIAETAWQFAKGVTSPIIGATRVNNLDDAAGAFDMKLTDAEIAYPEEPYLPCRVVGVLPAGTRP